MTNNNFENFAWELHSERMARIHGTKTLAKLEDNSQIIFNAIRELAQNFKITYSTLGYHLNKKTDSLIVEVSFNDPLQKFDYINFKMKKVIIIMLNHIIVMMIIFLKKNYVNIVSNNFKYFLLLYTISK